MRYLPAVLAAISIGGCVVLPLQPGNSKSGNGTLPGVETAAAGGGATAGIDRVGDRVSDLVSTGGPHPDAFPALARTAPLSGRVLGPARLVSSGAANLVSNNSGSLVGNGSANLVSNNSSNLGAASSAFRRRIAGQDAAAALEAPVASASVLLTDEAGRTLAGPVLTDEKGRFAFPAVSATGNVLLEASFDAAGKRYRLEGMARVAPSATASTEVNTATTLTIEKFKQVVASRGGSLETADPDRMSQLAGILAQVLVKAELPDLAQAPDTLAAAFDVLLQGDAPALEQARQTDPALAAPIARVVQLVSYVGLRPRGLAFGADGALYLAVQEGGSPRGEHQDTRGEVRRLTFDTDADVASNSVFATIDFPGGVAVDKHGNVWVTQSSAGRSYLPDGSSTVLPGRTVWRIDPAGNKLAVSAATAAAAATTEATTAATTAGGGLGFGAPSGIAFGPDGKCYVSSSRDGQGYVLRFDPAAMQNRGDGTAAVPVEEFVKPGQAAENDSAALVEPDLLAFSADGDLWIPDLAGPLMRASADGNLRKVVGTRAAGVAFDWAGNFYLSSRGGDPGSTAESSRKYFFKYNSAGELVTAINPVLRNLITQDIGPSGIAFDAKGNLYIADYQGGCLVRTIPGE